MERECDKYRSLATRLRRLFDAHSDTRANPDILEAANLLDGSAASSTRDSTDSEVTLKTTTGMFLALDRYNALLQAENFMRAMLDPVPSNARPYVCAGCGDWRLVKRCTKCDDKFYEPPIIEDGRSRPHWRCHKNEGHNGECSTHMDCGARHPDGGTCGFPPDHEGPHGWETPVSATRQNVMHNDMCDSVSGVGPCNCPNGRADARERRHERA